MSSTTRVLIVDDERDYCDMIADALEDEFECLTAYSGMEGLEKRTNFSPHVVITDVNMPGMTGLELCKKLKELPEQEAVAVFVISARDTVEAKLEAFNSGADDFIGKPFDFDELIFKVSRTADYIQQRNRLSEAELESRKMALASMADASQHGYITQFFKKLNYCGSEQDVAQLFMEAMDYFGLQSSLMLGQERPLYFDPEHNKISPIEENIYELLRNRGRLYEFGHRMVVNDSHVSFLVRKMPEDEVQAGKIRDVVAILVEGMEAKLLDIYRQQTISIVLGELKGAIQSVGSGIENHNRQVGSIMTVMISEIAASFHRLDLNDEQESFFTELIEKGGDKMSSMEESLLAVKDQLQRLLVRLETVAKTEREKPVSIDDSGDQVDLF